ncbi:GNAT family N-acetyltransferase [Gallaecimonas kandeliae]|uniref:GNAT family N-acetyltransferase n=1 Tax=Gallaecimonas kandeliae TaxID=3029055 RepID=UPI002648E095|nr:GNAT family N-acetyltransferase [Gallaecimonas kandeliae]WKE66886.1 GNAT family N-acetyltransferase [Gallaecimonas kandeliae]
MPLRVRPYRADDAGALARLFYESVHRSALGPYSQAELDAWAPYPIDQALWQRKLNELKPLVAEEDSQVLGFMTLERGGFIGLAFSHPDHQRRGVATALYQALEAQAREQGLARLSVDASKLARPFFEGQGFVVVRENQVPRHGQLLVNWTMGKDL